MLTCIIVDDEQHAIDVLAHYVRQTPSLQLISSVTNPMEALEILNSRPIDLVFLDIQMPEISGLDLVKALDKRTRVILTTAYSEFASQGFELEVVDYLLKPIPFPRFLRAVQRVQQLIFSGAADPASVSQSSPSAHPVPEESGDQADPDDYFFVKTELKGKMLKINFRDIDYIEGMKNYVAIHHNGTRTMALLNMKDLEDRLPVRQFMRIHRSFIIALNKITSIEGNRVMLRNIQAEILLGETYRAPFLERMKGKIME